MTHYTRRQLRARLNRALVLAKEAARHGRTPASDKGQPIAASLLNCGISQSRKPNTQFQGIVAFELAWGIDTPEAKVLAARRAVEKQQDAAIEARNAAALAAATPDDRARAEKYDSLSGKARKKYGQRHAHQLRRIYARAIKEEYKK